MIEELPEGLENIFEDLPVEKPDPGDHYEFELENDDIPERLVKETTNNGRVGDFKSDLRQYGVKVGFTRIEEDKFRYRLDIPSPGWPDPLGYATHHYEDDWEVEFQTPKSRINADNERFYAPVRGTICEKGDDRHEDLPEDAHSLVSVKIVNRERADLQKTFYRFEDVELPDYEWVAVIKYEMAGGRDDTVIYSSEIGDYPRVIAWNVYTKKIRHKRQRYEFFDTRYDAIEFVENQTGLPVREEWESKIGDFDGK